MIEELLAYQEQDKSLFDIEVELSKDESKKARDKARLDYEQADVEIGKLDIKAEGLVLSFQNAEKELDLLCEQKTEIEKSIEDLEDNDAISYSLKKIDELIAKIKKLSSDINDISATIMDTIKKFATAKEVKKNSSTIYTDNNKKYEEVKMAKKDEIDDIKAKLKVLGDKVDKDLLDRYILKRKEKIFPVLSEVLDDRCSYCKMQLSKNDLARLKAGELIECETCRRLLFKK